MRIGRYVTAHGRSLQEALEKAAQLLNAPVESLAHEVIDDGATVHRGSYKVRAVCVAPPPEESSSEDPIAVLDRVDPPWSEEALGAFSSPQFLKELERASYDHTELVVVDDDENTHLNETFREIHQDVSSTTGSIDHIGDLVIRGNVTFGVTIRATGSVVVDGDVEGAFIDCVKHLKVKGGILGTVRSRKGGVTCHYAHGAYIVADQRINVTESAIHSHLIAGVEIEVGDAIIGGRSYAHNILWAQSAGSEAGVPTRLVAGRNRQLRDRLDEIRSQATRLQNRLAQCKRLIDNLEPNERDGNALPGDQRVELWRAVSQKARLTNLALMMADERARIIKEIDRERTARIKIKDRVYPNTTIEIDDGAKEIRAVTHFATFSKDYETGSIRMTPYS